MAASPEHLRNSSSSPSSSCSVEVPDKREQEIGTDAKQLDSTGDSSPAISGDGSRAEVRFALDNGASEHPGTVHRSFSEVGASRVGTSNIEKLDSSQPKLVKSKTEAQRPWNILAEEAAQIFDNKISAQKKLKLLNRIATVKDDGTVEFEVPDVDPHVLAGGSRDTHAEVAEEESLETDVQYIPPLQIVMLIVGTRGDVQPFVAIGKRLQEYGHRVRLATHSNFKEFVLTAGLEFYPLGGDPKVLAGYMVKNKGFLPSNPSEIPTQRNQMKDIIYSLLPACKEPDPDSGIPFNADAIIANPPAYG
ncbi:hypothetical protein V6N13_100123 [Hibiscus sabdariffa]|uniref:Glycosyltransferase family 28 N-terminal domain-containing protein n=1 Tax=Hibiscus sabdariffa TaxID=183260 RepID=A0ABR2NUD5_9ROSI